ncbi:hypothetical protein BV898_00674 [Hypsibius exemplaris]|uniref:L-Fucosyltransferase n=1 Tax=Hypsibius exemplaris TaxID=2072580 RepID=A0A1W0XE50_HYPEX|nr:hypothetical protein BV898_00674 [Hypsibius exemplaris]
MDYGQDANPSALLRLVKEHRKLGLSSAKAALLLLAAFLVASFLFTGVGNARSLRNFAQQAPNVISFLTRSAFESPEITWAQVTSTITEKLQQKIQTRLEKARRYHESLSNSIHLQNPTTPRLLFLQGSGGRLGNFLFCTASLIGIARRNQYTPIYLINDERTTLFTGLNIEILNRTDALRLTRQTTLPEISEKGAAIYSDYIADFPLQHGNQSVILSGFLQSFKYFHAFRDEIRTALTFTEAILTQAVQSINDSLNALHGENNGAMYRRVPRLVGIHVRRGDITAADDLKNFGFLGATIHYVMNTIRLVRRLHRNSGTVFLVVTDDVDYCLNVLQLRTFKDVAVVSSKDNPPAVDLAVLSLTETVIMTVGTFGWWGGYLSESEEVYYYRKWPKKKSRLAKLVERRDYFLPTWHGWV